jgi:hypothetical protein
MARQHRAILADAEATRRIFLDVMYQTRAIFLFSFI